MSENIVQFVSRFPLAYEAWKRIEREETITGKIEALDAFRQEAEERERVKENEAWQEILQEHPPDEFLKQFTEEQRKAIYDNTAGAYMKAGRARLEAK